MKSSGRSGGKISGLRKGTNDEPYNIGVRGAINMTRKAPTIEPKRGKWIKRKRKCEYKCSECGKIVFADDENELNFCCSCGADMREREGE